jgi:hypothetical protein
MVELQPATSLMLSRVAVTASKTVIYYDLISQTFGCGFIGDRIAFAYQVTGKEKLKNKGFQTYVPPMNCALCCAFVLFTNL